MCLYILIFYYISHFNYYCSKRDLVFYGVAIYIYIYIYIYLLTAIELTPGGSSTVHIYTHTHTHTHIYIYHTRFSLKMVLYSRNM